MNIRYSILGGLGLFFLLLGFSACKKENIAPAEQEMAFVKFFGHTRDQEGQDLKRTADGGYLLLGSTNSYRNEAYYDMYVVKTDSFGNEEWSRKLGDANVDERGRSIVVLSDKSGYLIAGTRQEIVIRNGQIIYEPSRIVLYKLTLTGDIQQMVVLRSSLSQFSDFIHDIKEVPENFGGGFALTGKTTGISDKPGSQARDSTDILTVRLQSDFTMLWDRTYGFNGRDEGVSVEFIGNNVIVTGSSEENSNFLSRIIVIAYRQNTGGVVNQINENISTPGNTLAAGTCLMSSERLIVYAYQTSGSNAGDLILVDFDVADVTISQVGPIHYLGKNILNSGDFFINRLIGRSIVPAPEENSLVMTATHELALGNETVHSYKILLNRNEAAINLQWRNTFGSAGNSNRAGTIIRVEDPIPGTEQFRTNGYALTGTFSLGTNNMLGLAKINTLGSVRPSSLETE